MKSIFILLCSPRPDGVTDHMGRQFAAGAASAGASVIMHALRDYVIAPCTGCGACKPPPHNCILATDNDDAEKLFNLVLKSQLAVFASPIYFYALPAHFKAFIDRGQRFWAFASSDVTAKPKTSPKPAISLLAAGRPKGELLFDGALRTLTWFLKNLDAALAEKLVFRGLDSVAELKKNPEILESLFMRGKSWGTKLTEHDSLRI